MEQTQALANQNAEGAQAVAEVRSGRQEFMNIIAGGEYKSMIDSGIQKIADIESKAVTAMTTLQKQIQDNHYKEATDSYNALTKLLDAKTASIDKIHTAAKDMNQQIIDNAKAMNDNITANLNQQKLQQEIDKATASNYADIVAANLTGDPTQDQQIVQAFATQLGIDPALLQSQAMARQQDLQKQNMPSGVTGDWIKALLSGAIPAGTSLSDFYNMTTGTFSGDTGTSTGGAGGFPAGAQNDPTGAAAVNNVSGLKGADGKFIVYNSPQESMQATINDIQAKIDGNTKTGLNANSTLDQFAKTWTGEPNPNYTGADLAATLGVSSNTTIGQVGAQNLAAAVARAETGYTSGGTSTGMGDKNSGVNKSTGEYTGPSLDKGATPQQIIDFLSSGPSLNVKGGASYDQKTLFNGAILSLLGAPDSSIGGMGSVVGRSAIGNKLAAITSALGITGADMAAAKADYAGLKGAQIKLATQGAFINVYGKTALDNLNLAQQESQNVPRTGAKMVNNYLQWAESNFTQAPAGPLAKLQLYIYTASREYAKVTSGGAGSVEQLNQEAQKQVDKLINAAQNPQTFNQVIDGMKNDMNNVLKETQAGLSKLPSSINDILGKIYSGSGTSTTDNSGTTGSTIRIQDPKTKEVRVFDSSQAAAARAAGYNILQ